MKFVKLSSVLFSIVFVISALSPLSSAGTDKQGRVPDHSRPQIAFNFVDVEISTIVKFISEITGNNFLFDERIKGKITIIAPTKLSIDESFTLFTSVLNLKGFTIIPTGPRTYKIIPSSLAKQEGIISPDEALPINEGYITKLIPVENIKAEETLQFLRPVISRDGHISSFGPGNLLLVVDSATNIDKIMSLLRLIDKPSVKEEAAGIHVYFLEYADATDLAKVLQGIIKDLQTSYKSGQRAAPKTAAAPDSPPVLSVTPDKASNSLVIVAPYSDYQNIVQVVRTLDKKRKQVFVEAMIVEASIDKLKDLGTKWRAIATHNNEPIVVGGVGTIGSATLLDIINGLSGMSIGGMGNFFDIPVTSVNADGTASSQNITAPGFAALFSLSDFKDAVNVLSTPQILTSDNQEAEILVGENVPFISQRERDLTTTTTVLNSITRTDVGIKLQITPQITEGDYVKLDIFQEISSVKSASDDILINVGPTTTKRSTKTSVLVKDGRTVVIGGLMQERDEESVVKIPLLGDIPLIGWLFKFKSVSSTKTNLLVFLSPHVIKESPQLTKLTEEKHREFVTTEKLYRQGELLVKFREDVSKERALEIISERKAAVIKHFESINVYHVRLESGQDVEDAVKVFSSLPEVLYAEPNYKVKLQSPPEEIDKKETAPGTDMNKTDSLLHDEKTSSPGTADIEKPAPAVTNNNSPVSNDKKELFPQMDIEKKKTSSVNEVSEPALIVPTQTSSSHQVIEDTQVFPPADTKKTAAAETKQTAGPQQIQPANNTGTAKAADENMKTAGKDNSPSLENIHAPDNRSGVHSYYIQVGAWLNVKYALNTLEKLKARYPDTYMAEEGGFSKVRIPGTMDKKKDSLLLKELKERFNLKPLLVNNKI